MRTEDIHREGRGVGNLWRSERRRLRDHIERKTILIKVDAFETAVPIKL
jgi:hypothetical protein